jgi:hypothetical protein
MTGLPVDGSSSPSVMPVMHTNMMTSITQLTVDVLPLPSYGRQLKVVAFVVHPSRSSTLIRHPQQPTRSGPALRLSTVIRSTLSLLLRPLTPPGLEHVKSSRPTSLLLSPQGDDDRLMLNELPAVVPFRAMSLTSVFIVIARQGRNLEYTLTHL